MKAIAWCYFGISKWLLARKIAAQIHSDFAAFCTLLSNNRQCKYTAHLYELISVI